MKNLATITEIAQKLKVSASTVSRALHDHRSIGLRTKMRVRQLAGELNYEPNQAAIRFQQRKTATIGVILPELSESFFSAAFSAVEDTSYKCNYSVFLGQSHDSEAKEKQIVDTMKSHRVDGLIVSIAKNTTNYDHFEMLKKYDIPVVFFDRVPNIPDIHCVSCNMESGTLKAMNFLLKSGHRVIGMINGPENLFASQQRMEGYMKAMKSHPLKFDPDLVISSDLTKEGTEKAMAQLLSLKRKITALISFNDYVALDAIQFAREQNIKINEDIIFVSYSNMPMSNHTASPPVASLEQFPYQQGQKATEILMELLNKKESDPPTTLYQKITLESHLAFHKNRLIAAV